jgi:hypothetical protein
MTSTPRTGRCQHCGQTRPLFEHEGELQFWGYDPSEKAWLCTPDWQARETAIDNDQPFRINQAIKPFAGQPEGVTAP